MTFAKTLAVGTFLASTLLAGTAFAKGHDNGFGAGLAGDLPPGAVASGVRNNDKDGSEPASESSYGDTVRDEAKAGERDNSDLAHERNMTR